MENKKFYCYSYQLAKFVQAEGHKCINRYMNKEGRWVWIFEKTEAFNETLVLWDEYKTWKKVSVLAHKREIQERARRFEENR
jgi:hypothetical protein